MSFLRTVVRLAIDAAKVELERWAQPTQEPAPAAVPVTTKPVSKRFDPKTNVRCIACAAHVTMGVLICKKCEDGRKRGTRKAVARG